MSFLQQTANFINPQLTLNMNDIVFVMLMCFQIGRLYEQRHNIFGRYREPYLLQNRSYDVEQMDQNCSECRNIHLDQEEQKKSEQIAENVSGDQVTQLHITEHRSISIKEQNINKNQKQSGYFENKLNQSLTFGQPQKLEFTQIINKTSIQAKSNEKQNMLIPQKEFLLEKVKLQGQKIQQKGKFELLFQKGQGNLNLIRKIQKHEIITDYILKKQINNSHYKQLAPHKKQSQFPSQNSVVEVQYYKNYQTNPPTSPLMEKKIIQLNQKSQGVLNSLFQHGKFKKLYRSIIKIGQGGFGIVYEAFNILQSKKYAIKKVFINKNSKQIENQLNEIKILNNLSHPNMVKYNTCWLQYAQLSEHTAYQKLLEGLANKNQNNQKSKGAISIRLIQNQQDQQQIDQSELEQSYFASKNSGFSFARSSRQATKKSLKLSKRDSFEVALREQQKNQIETTAASTFGLLPVMYIQMELCEHSLAYYIRKRKYVDRAFAYEIMDQLINGVMYIHTNRVVHRDLKPQNILFAANNGHITVKIGDFGLALHIGSKQQGNEKFTISNNKVGTPSYIAPEFYLNNVKKLNQQDLQKADVYSLAVIYYQILNKFETTHQRGQKLSLLKQGKVVGINQFKQQKKFIQQLIRHNRPKAKQIHGTQQWKKLSQVICKLKRKAYRQAKIQKKDSNSTAYSSNMSKNCSSSTLYQFDKTAIESNSHKKQKLKHRQKNKNKNYNNYEGSDDKQVIERLISQTQIEQNEDGVHDSEQQRQNSDDLEIEIFKQNLQLIRRVSSVSSNKQKNKEEKGNDNKKENEKNKKSNEKKKQTQKTPTKKGKNKKQVYPDLNLEVQISEGPQHQNQMSSSLE